MASGAVGGEEMKHAETTLASAQERSAGAQSALAAAREQAASQPRDRGTGGREASQRRTGAAAAVREAGWRCSAPSCPRRWRARSAKRTVQVGQRVPPARR